MMIPCANGQSPPPQSQSQSQKENQQQPIIISTIHVFDFDGTLFRSPAPHPRLDDKFGEGSVEKLKQPVISGGYGWFQDHRTLSLPYIPSSEALVSAASNSSSSAESGQQLQQRPQHFNKRGEALSTLFVEPVCQRLRDVQRQPGTLVLVMTGRDRTYRHIIEQILRCAGLTADRVLLKPHHGAGTVKYKVSSFISMVANHMPRHIEYYEDRLEQGEKIEAGVRFVQWLLQHLLRTSADNNNSNNNNNNNSLNVEDDSILQMCGVPPRLLTLVPPYHRAHYMRDIEYHQLVIKYKSKQQDQQQQQLGGGEEANSGGDPVEFGDHMPHVADVDEQGIFTFCVHYVKSEWHADSFLEETLEEQLFRELVASAEQQMVQQQDNSNGGSRFGDRNHHYRGGGGGGRGSGYYRGGGRGGVGGGHRGRYY